MRLPWTRLLYCVAACNEDIAMMVAVYAGFPLVLLGSCRRPPGGWPNRDG